jgi:hypothetical protein
MTVAEFLEMLLSKIFRSGLIMENVLHYLESMALVKLRLSSL